MRQVVAVLHAVFDPRRLMLPVVVLFRLGKPDGRKSFVREGHVVRAARDSVAPQHHPQLEAARVQLAEPLHVPRPLAGGTIVLAAHRQPQPPLRVGLGLADF